MLKKKKSRKIQEQVNELRYYHIDPERLELISRNSVDLKDQLLRNNLRNNGISKKENENWEESEQEIQSLIKDKLEIDENTTIETTHQIKKRTVIIQENPEE